MTVGIQQLMRSMEQLRDGYRWALYTARDLDAALASTTDGYTVRHMPAGTGTGPGAGIWPRTYCLICPPTWRSGRYPGRWTRAAWSTR